MGGRGRSGHLRGTGEVDAVLRALAHPVRRRAIELMARRDTDAGEISIVAFQEFSSMPSTVSGHLRTLRDAGLVVSAAHESERVYTVRPRAVHALARWAQDVDEATPGAWIPFEVH